MIRKEILLASLIFLSCHTLNDGVIQLHQKELRRFKRDVESSDPSSLPSPSDKCLQLTKMFNAQSKPTRFGTEIHLDSEKSMLQLTWLGKDHEKILLVASDYTSNTIWLSETDYSFENITDSVFEGNSFEKHRLYLMHHPLSSMTAYIGAVDMASTSGSDIYISTDAADSFKKVSLEFTISSSSVFFHPSKANLILALDDSAMKLYLSKDKGFTWQLFSSDVTKAKWSTNPFFPDDIFVIRNTKVKRIFFGLFKYIDPRDNVLYRFEDLSSTNSSVLLKRNIFSIGSENVFLYASIILDTKAEKKEERIMQVSSDAGRSWNRVQLPTITSDRFYSILDLSSGIIFLHVDNPGDTGRGVLYSSDATGIIFSKSLENHLFPNYGNVVDFYRVLSANGTFITSIIAPDDSVKTLITYNRGAEWHFIRRPPHVPCHNESGECTLHIHYQYSQFKGINAAAPLSVASAPGLIIAHGHVAESLQTSTPDVYVSNDGGHSWTFALKGPHQYQIADQGNLIFAISLATAYPDHILFSTDRGRCWISHKFTNEKLYFKALLTTPDNLDKTLAVWGYTLEDKKWHSFAFNFEDVVTEKCKPEDYEEWSPKNHRNDSCVLGISATFKRARKDSWCLNNQRTFDPFVRSRKCQCTEDDYKCDYGYKRVGEKCEKDVNVVEMLHICLRNHHQSIVPLGYHKIPGDQCEGGFSPPASKWVDLKTQCKGVTGSYFFKGLKNQREGELQRAKEEGDRAKGRKIFFIIFFFALVITTIIILVLLARKYKVFNRQSTYTYSSIKADDGDESNTLMDDNDSEDTNSQYQDLSAAPVSPQQPGFIHPKLMVLTNPHLLDQQPHKSQHALDDDAKFIAESDVELLE